MAAKISQEHRAIIIEEIRKRKEAGGLPRFHQIADELSQRLGRSFASQSIRGIAIKEGLHVPLTLEEANAQPARREASRGQMRGQRTDPTFIAKGKEALRKAYADPEFAAEHAARASERLKKLHTRSEFATEHAARASKHMKKLHADPRFRLRRLLALDRRKNKSDGPK